MEEQRSLLRRLHEWAVSLDREGLVKLGTYHAKGGDMMTLLPRLRADNAGLVTIYNYSGTPSLQFWRGVFERRAPKNLPRVEQLANLCHSRTSTSSGRRSPRAAGVSWTLVTYSFMMVRYLACSRINIPTLSESFQVT
jgi:hypothetical protein